MKPAIHPRPRPLIYGHRGCRGLRPENTLPAFLHALEWSITDGLEMDVIVSADGMVVVSHEPWLNALICLGALGQRLTEAEGQAHNLLALPYAAIRQFDCGSLVHPRFPEQQPAPAPKPLLTEVLKACEAYAAGLKRPLPRYSIELKSAAGTDGVYHPVPTQFVARVWAAIVVALPPARLASVTLLSFDHRVVQATAAVAPGASTCLLLEDSMPLPEHLHRLGFVPDYIGPSHDLIDALFLDRCSRLRLPIVAWTVNEPSRMEELARLGIAGITTDYPDRATAVFGA